MTRFASAIALALCMTACGGNSTDIIVEQCQRDFECGYTPTVTGCIDVNRRDFADASPEARDFVLNAAATCLPEPTCDAYATCFLGIVGSIIE